jgi:hypothetical protein
VDGSTTEFGSVGSGYIAMPADTARFAMILTIVKGAPNFTVWNEIPITAAGNYAIPKTLFAQDVETIAHRNYTNSTRLTDEADRAVAVDEATNGYFDNVCLYWQGTGFEIELSALYLQRVTNPNV